MGRRELYCAGAPGEAVVFSLIAELMLRSAGLSALMAVGTDG
jgi:hypothetical protein